MLKSLRRSYHEPALPTTPHWPTAGGMETGRRSAGLERGWPRRPPSKADAGLLDQWHRALRVSPKDMKVPRHRRDLETRSRQRRLMISLGEVCRARARWLDGECAPGDRAITRSSGRNHESTFRVCDTRRSGYCVHSASPWGAMISPNFLARYLALASNRVLKECSKDGTTVNSIEVSALERLLESLSRRRPNSAASWRGSMNCLRRSPRARRRWRRRARASTPSAARC